MDGAADDSGRHKTSKWDGNASKPGQQLSSQGGLDRARSTPGKVEGRTVQLDSASLFQDLGSSRLSAIHEYAACLSRWLNLASFLLNSSALPLVSAC